MAQSLATSQIAAHWWVPLVRGLISIAFGVVIFLHPFSAVAAFVIVFGAYAFVDGILNIVTALRFAHPRSGSWWMILAQGVVGVLVGIVTFVVPAVTAATLALLIAIWAIVTGILEIVAAFRLRADVPNEIFLILSGLLSLIVGAWLLLVPFAALLAATWLIGAYALAGGITLVVLAFRLRRLRTASV